MSEDWAAIAAEVSEAVASVGFTATLTRTTFGPLSPWDRTSSDFEGIEITVVDSGWRTIYGPGMVERQAHMLTVAAGTVAPKVGDRITLHGKTHHILRVEPLAPGGVALLYDVEIEA